MIDWTKKIRTVDAIKAAKVRKASTAMDAETSALLAAFMDAVLDGDQSALARLRKYRQDLKAWLAAPGGPDLESKPKRNGAA
jgi:hypothetical protein